ncbi:MAG: hypothetical protein HYZ58_01455, partial [Acidobacteria bacterium]|nr:hypothetical protein [Acidobacteriota bacterium]
MTTTIAALALALVILPAPTMAQGRGGGHGPIGRTLSEINENGTTLATSAGVTF